MPPSDVQQYDLASLDRRATIPPDCDVLEQGYYDPAGAIWAARHARRVVALRPAIDQAAAVMLAAQKAGLSTVDARLAVRPEATEQGSFGAALLLAPFFLGNAPVRDALTVAAWALRSDGVLYFQAHRRHGAQTYVRFAQEVFGTVEQLGIGDGQRRLYQATMPQAGVSLDLDGDTLLHEVSHAGVTIHLRLAAGVFAAREIDPGSWLLLQAVEIPPGARILDMGCGAGTIGLALAASTPRAAVVLVDSSRPAVDLARENAARNNLANVDVRLSDGYAAVPGEHFDAVMSNLPAHRGHQADSATAERFIAGAAAHLRPDGVAWFVANRALPYELPAARAFREVRQESTDGRYKVLRCTGPRARPLEAPPPEHAERRRR